MSQLAKQLFSGFKEAAHAVMEIAPGTQNLFQDVKAELSRQGSLGAQELASALFSGNAFVLYGGKQEQHTTEHTQEPEHQHSGMER